MPAQPAGSDTGTATILFTDLVGSTEQRTHLGEETAETVRRTHDRLLADAVAAHHGTVAKNVGDGIMATFAGAAHAVGAAVAIQQAIDGYNRRAASVPLRVRIGISLGDVTWENGDCFGSPVIEAARLCAVAEGGQILAAELVRLSARGRGGHSFAPLGPLALKGLGDPVAACAVAWEPLVLSGVPLPPRLGPRLAQAMVGRGREADVLGGAWAKAKRGERQVVLLAGEPGIGKTRLAAEAARMAHADGGTVLFGACDEDVGTPYRPFVEALGHCVAHAPDEVLEAHVRAHRGELGRLVPNLAARVPDLPKPQVAEADTERYLLFEAAVDLLAAASHRDPIVLVLDDLHWAGTPELLLLKHLVRSATPMRLLIVATYRDTELAGAPALTALLADLRRETGIERVALRGLDDAAVAVLVTATAGLELAGNGVALAQAIHRESEGNPFFVGEILRHLVEAGSVRSASEQGTFAVDVAGSGIPEGIKEVISRRLARLSDATGTVLGLAAVIGRQFDLPLLIRVADLPEDAVLDALDAAIAAALVVEVPGRPDHLGFSHTLIRTTLYEALSSARRARLHRRVGEALEELTRGAPAARIDELAHHWFSAARGEDLAMAIDYGRQAGDHALANLAFEEAAAHYQRALGALEPRDRAGELLRCDLLIALGAAQRNAGNAAYRDTVTAAAAAARRLGDVERLAHAALGQAQPGGFLTTAMKVDAGAVALYEEAAALLRDEGVLRARVLAQLAVELMYTPQRERRHALAREALDLARRAGDRAGLGQVLVASLWALNDPFTLAERLRLAAELEALAETVGSHELGLHAAFQTAGAALEAGDRPGVERVLARMEQFAAKLRQPFYPWCARWVRAMWSITQGSSSAEQDALAAFEFGTAHGQPDAGAVFAAQLLNVRHDQGRLTEITDGVQASVEALPHIPAWRAALATTYCETDRIESAREQFAVLAGADFEMSYDWSWYCAMVHCAQTCDYLRDQDAAARLYALLAPIAEQVGSCTVALLSYGSVGYPAGLLAACLGKWEDAERHFEHALAANERLGTRPYLVRTRRAYAAMLLDRNAPGDAGRARDLIAAARAEAEALGMARELWRLEQLHARAQA